MSRYQTTISNLIQGQFPAFYNEDGQTLIAFLEAYYEWLEQTGNPLYYSRRLYEISDIDTTLDEFVVHFTNTYLVGIQYDILADKRLTVKKIIDLYGAKGSLRAIKLLFQLIYKEDIEIYLPGFDVLKPSDGTWTTPVYLEVSNNNRNDDYINKQITGVNSGATAFVDRIVTRKNNGQWLTLYYITNQNKDFIVGETLSVDGNLNGAPYLLGSLNELTVVQGSSGFSVGQIVDIISQSNLGKNGKAKVAAVTDTTGIVSFTLVDGGWGYTSNSTILISNTIIYLSNVQSTSPINDYPIKKFSTVTITDPGNLSANATANVFAYSNNAALYVNNVTGTFQTGETVYCSVVADANTAQLIYSNAVVTSTFPTSNSSGAFNVILVDGVYKSFFKNGLTLTGASSAATGTLYKSEMDVGVVSLLGTITANHTVLTTTTGNAIITGVSTGINANIQITGVTSTETVPLFTDYISDKSTTALNAATYSFTKYPAANLTNGVLAQILNYSFRGIGTIQGILTLNPGQNYNDNPYVEVYERPVAALNKKDYVLNINNVTGSFVIGEPISQSISYSSLSILQISAPVFSNSYTGATALFIPGELVYQNNGLANVAQGSVVSGNTSLLYVNVATGTFTTAYKVIGLTSAVNSSVTSVGPGGTTQIATGTIETSSSSSIYAKRQSVTQDFLPSSSSASLVVGSVSGATANITSVGTYGNGISGYNAVITTKVTTGNGSVTSLLVTDSGFGYSNAEVLVNFTSSDKQNTGTAIPYVLKQGTGSGYYASTKGFLSADKYIQDGDYYQSFSYQIESSLDVSRYAQVVKDAIHVAGTKMFGAVVKKSTLTTSPNIDNSNSPPIIG
jgi:hypothetical protein